MKQMIARLAMRAHAALMLSLAATAPALMALCRYAPGALAVYPVFPAAAVLSAALCVSLPGRRRVPAALLCAALLFALGGALLPVASAPALWLLPAGASIVLLASLPMSAGAGVSPSILTVGLAAQLLCHAAALLTGRTPAAPYAPVLPAMTAVFVVYLLLCLLAMNSASLSSATMGRHRAARSVRRFNQVLVLAFMALSLVIASLPAVARAAAALWRLIVSALVRLAQALAALLPEAAPIGTGGGMPPDDSALPVAAAEPSALAVLLERVMIAVSIVLAAALAVLLARALFRRLRALLALAMARLRLYVAAASEEEDEITDTREEGGERRSVLPGLLRRMERSAKTPEGRVRQAYARLYRRRADWAASSTARENLPPQAADVYERARYSDHPVTGEEADRFASNVRKL